MALLALASATAQGQVSTPSVAAPATTASAGSAGLANEWLREESTAFNPFDLGGQFRARYVYQTYFAVPGAGATAVDFRANTPQKENDFLLLRTRFHAGYTPADWLSLFAEGQNSSSSGDKRNPNTQSDGPADLRQAFVRVGGAKELPLSLKAGRQELAYGEERLVGRFEWDNVGRVFDAAKLRYEQSDFWVEAFSGRVVIANDNKYNRPNWDDWFSGIYVSTTNLVPKIQLDGYFMSDNASPDSLRNTGTAGRGNSARDIYTVGSRFQTLPGQLGGWDFNGEFAGQFGDFAYAAGTPGVVTGQRLNHMAYATHLEGGYSLAEVRLKPRFALGLDHASGDGDPKDKEHNTFVNLYPTNHKFYGAMDFFSWQNVIDPYFTATITPVKEVSVVLTYNAFWLASTSDFYYQVNQAPRTTGGYGIHAQNGSFLGHELDLVATYQPKRFLQFQVGYGHFFTGRYVEQTFDNSGGAHDANWVYVQGQLNF